MTAPAPTALRALQVARGASFTTLGDAEAPARYGDPRIEYEAAQAAAALADVSSVGKLLFSGPDRRDFLQGLLTNDVSLLTPGHSSPGCLLDVHGKLTAEFWLHDRGEDFLAVSPDPEMPARLSRALARHFSLAETEAKDLSADLAAFFLAGPKAAMVLERFFGRPWPSEPSALPAAWNGVPFWILRCPLFGVEGLLLLLDRAAAADAWRAFEAAGGPFGLKLMGHEALEMFRIEAGLPRFGVDVDASNYPVEAGWDGRVSDEKGCYLGQEITARIRTRGKVPRRLAAVETEAPAAPGDAVSIDGKEAARVTSSAPSPRLGKHLSLALLPAEAGAVTLAGRPGRVVPFPGRS